MKKVEKKPVQKSMPKTKTEVICTTKNCSSGCGGVFYGLGFVGSAAYYISTATGFWNGVWGLLKAIVWPAFLIFELLKFLGV